MAYQVSLTNDYRNLGKPITEGEQGLRLDRYLAKAFPFLSRLRWQNQIRNGHVLVSGIARKASYQLRLDDVVKYYYPETIEPEVDTCLKELWQNENVLAVYKPSGLPMHEAGRFLHKTFCNVVKEQFQGDWSPVHRLDRETSGIVLCANDTSSRNVLSRAFYSHKVHKTYYAIVIGVPKENKWEVDAPIGQVSGSIIRLKQYVTPNGLPALTFFEKIDEKNGFSLLKVEPRSGRTHQIRVHATYSGFPLVGDKKYNFDDTIFAEYMDHGYTERVAQACYSERLCLHAAAIRFPLPEGSEKSVYCTIPEDMQKIWESL